MKKGHEWSLVATVGTGDTPPGESGEYSDVQYLYTLVNIPGTSPNRAFGVTEVPDGTQIFKKHSDVLFLNIREDVEIGDLVFELPTLHTDTGNEVVSYHYLLSGDHEYFTFDANAQKFISEQHWILSLKKNFISSYVSMRLA